MKPMAQVGSPHRRVRYAVSQRIRDQSAYATSIEVLLTRREIHRGLQTICLKCELQVVSLALNASSRLFELPCGATFATVCLQQVCIILLRRSSEVQLRDWRDYYQRRGSLLRKHFGRRSRQRI